MTDFIGTKLVDYARQLEYTYNEEKVYISNVRLLDIEQEDGYNKDVAINIYQVGSTTPISSFGKEYQFESVVFEIAVRTSPSIDIYENDKICREFAKKLAQGFDADNVISCKINSAVNLYGYDNQERLTQAIFITVELNEYYDNF